MTGGSHERGEDDTAIRDMSPKTQQAHIGAVRYFAEFIERSPDTATPDELRAYQLKWSGTFGQRAKMYPTLTTGHTNDEETQFFGQV
ncbi:Phage integrase, N-terminal SAM-like domain [Epibacterium ulvae]|uniref:Phage integrase, N-terminal SAM-like domain n=1 Tax=Epibacterium ulvae TaxID=1156985 RepID=A0A1G5QS54_9RHOB|nr:phage integrase N-terminal SAM-like domain-containing protein [Epibacterium ulvae]SCZ64683.1 Phage integrase, N-terminal SAM-like domain [Epibacterium ulvae]